MKKILKMSCLPMVFLFISGFAEKSIPDEQAPNVILIYTDDQGTLDLNILGATDLITPHMDAIAQSGILFNNFYGHAVCSPSRASLLTGKVPAKAGVPTNVNETNGLTQDQYTMSSMFKAAGYSTALIGKWHLGETEGKLPNDHGFDYFFGHTKGCIDNYSHFFYWRGPNRHNLFRNKEEVYYPGHFFPDLMLKESKTFISSVEDNPFFLYFAINLPHYPYQGNEKWLKLYRQKGVKYPRDEYAAFLSTQDEIIGELMDFLETSGLTESTIVILQSDNGHSTEYRAHFGGGYTGVFRGAKSCLFEGGIRVPAAISWPSKIPAGQVREQMGVCTDWMPTLAELCDIKLETEDIDGKSLLPIIYNPSAISPHEKSGFYWQHARSWAIRKGKWKLHANPRDAGLKDRPYLGIERFLVNLEEDPGETTNLAELFPEIVNELESLYLDAIRQ
jgi:arylsulfatase A